MEGGGGSSKPLLARWTSEWDCGFETRWWFVIKDNEWDVSSLKAKRRYEVNKGRKNFTIRLISPKDYAERLFDVQVAAFSAYPKKYRPRVNKETFINNCCLWKGACFGAFKKVENGSDTEMLCGYSYLTIDGNCIHFSVQKTNPLFEKEGLNAALVDGVLTYFNPELVSGKYICDGERNINHETNFQDYLEKYFGFRKAYCKLHITYNPIIRWSIPILFFAKKYLRKADGIGIVHCINSVLAMEEIVRKR